MLIHLEYSVSNGLHTTFQNTIATNAICSSTERIITLDNQQTNSTSEDDRIHFSSKESPNTTFENNQIWGGENKNETVDCITKEEAINRNLKVYHSRPFQFLKLKLWSNYDRVRKTLKVALQKSARHHMEVKHARSFFHGECHIYLNNEDLDKSLQDSIKKIMTSFLEYQRKGRNFLKLDKVIELQLNVAKYHWKALAL